MSLTYKDMISYRDIFLKYYNTNYIKFVLINVFKFQDEKVVEIVKFINQQLSFIQDVNQQRLIKEEIINICCQHDFYERFIYEEHLKPISQKIIEKIYIELDYDYDELHEIIIDGLIYIKPNSTEESILDLTNVYQYFMSNLNMELRKIKNKNLDIERNIRDNYKDYIDKVIDSLTVVKLF